MRHSTTTSGIAPRRRGYSLLEVLITVLIINIISGMVAVNVSGVQTSEKLTRGGQQVIAAVRYARMLAMTTGQNAGVEFDASTNRVRVYQGSVTNTVSNSLMPNGTYVLDFGKQADVGGLRITAANIVGSAASPYRITFGTLGGTNNTGSITLSYGSQSKVIEIPAVGDPMLK